LHFNAFNLLADSIAWVYQVYQARGFSSDYFVLEVKAWIKAVAEHLEADAAQAVNEVYRWWLSHHEDLITLSQDQPSPAHPLDLPLELERQAFFAALLQGEYRECLRLADQIVTDRETLGDFYLQVIQPCLYRVGSLWQRGEISIAHEHLASAVVDRVMATAYTGLGASNGSKGQAVVTVAPNEFHEIGARMVADFLSLDGWEIRYLGANMPTADLLRLMATSSPFLVAISTGIPCNLMDLTDVVQGIKSHPWFKEVRLMVGGQLFPLYPDLWRLTGADGWAPDAQAATALARQWWEAR
jgi:methanogenic corrinoid protein MtbC1